MIWGLLPLSRTSRHVPPPSFEDGDSCYSFAAAGLIVAVVVVDIVVVAVDIGVVVVVYMVAVVADTVAVAGTAVSAYVDSQEESHVIVVVKHQQETSLL